MAKAVRLSINRGIIVLALLALGACAGSAPSLPEQDKVDTNNPYIYLNCAEINAKKKDILAQREAPLAAINGDRQHNQVMGYFGAFLPPLLFTTEGHDIEKKQLLDLQKRWDDVIGVERDKSCKNDHAPIPR